MRGGFWRKSDRPNLFFPIYVNPIDETVSIEKREGYEEFSMPIQPSTNIEGTWRWGKEKIKEQSHLLIAKKVSRNGKMVWDVFQKDYLDRGEERRTKSKSIWDGNDVNYQNGSDDIKSLLGSSGIFDYSKPQSLIKHLISIVNHSENDTILDFFSGSSSSAHAVMQLNAEDGSNRKFIMVQLPEATDEKSEAYKAGYKNICEIGKERIRRAGKKILEEQKAKQGDLFSGEQKKLDVGFRVLKLDSSNMQDVYYSPEQFNENLLFEDNIKPDRTDEDLLFQAMIELGIELSATIEQREIAGKTVWNVAEGYLMACFDKEVNETAIKAIAKQHPYYFVLRDASLATDQVADNFEQIWEEYSKDTIRRII